MIILFLGLTQFAGPLKAQLSALGQLGLVLGPTIISSLKGPKKRGEAENRGNEKPYPSTTLIGHSKDHILPLLWRRRRRRQRPLRRGLRGGLRFPRSRHRQQESASVLEGSACEAPPLNSVLRYLAGCSLVERSSGNSAKLGSGEKCFPRICIRRLEANLGPRL